jgi:hypothetical protein
MTLYERGREYALSQIDKYENNCIPRLEIEADTDFDFGDFERGMLAAIRDYLAKTVQG